MRLFSLVLVVLPAFAAYSRSLAGADGIMKVETAARGSANEQQAVHGSKKASIRLADEERMVSVMQKIEQLFPFIKNVKTKINNNPTVVKTNAMIAKDKRLKGTLSVLKDQLIAIAIMAALALGGGYVMYSITK